ncbi:hypothetical protein [uncultured Enterococcus sp.]|uniref:hypothetical protein n=1 Tax=uncultured Enterococcus sp. TaxID=167972 RepID=UPI002AA7F759|nr:hypothetical protein [uncultured Enterococcus sp.]
MNKFKALVQLQVRSYGLNKLRHQSRGKFIGVLVGVVLLVMMAISYLLGIAFLLIGMGLASYVPSLMFFLSSAICLVITFMKGSRFLFGFNDFDILMSLPLTPRIIIAGKLLGLYLLNLLFSLLAIVPAMMLYCWHVQELVPLLGAVLLVPFVPLLPLLLGLVLTTVISLIASNFRYQQLVVVLLSLGAVIALLAGSFSLTGYDSAEMNQLLRSAMAQMERFYPLAEVINKGFSGQPLLLLLFIIISVVPMFLFIVILDRYYLSIHALLTVRVKKGHFKLETFRQRSVFSSLLMKELRLCFSSSLYVTNSVIGAILFLAAAISLPFAQGQLSAALPPGSSIEQYVSWLPYIPCLFLGITTTTSAAISMEGKNYWQYASLPIPVGKIYQAKLMVNLLLFFPPLWIGCTVLSIAFVPTAFSVFLLFLLPTCFCLFMCIASLKLNQLYPNFKWVNEQQVIKQSLPVLLTMLLGLVTTVLAAGSALLINNRVIAVLGTSIILLALSIVAWHSLQKRNAFVE